LRAFLRFDEQSGSFAGDATGNGWNGTLNGGTTWVAGKINNAVSFSGSSNYATLPNGVMAGVTDFTISAWVKLNTANNTRIFDFGTGTSGYMELCPKNSSNGYMRYEIVSGGTVQQINTTYAFPTGVWTHVAITQSGSTGTLYINGASVGTNTGLTLKPANLGTTTLNYIGKSQWNDPYLNGSVDEFQIYGRALSASEIGSLANSLAAPTGLTATAGYSQVDCAWNTVAGATSYNLKRAYLSGGPYTTLATLTGTTYTDTTTVPESPYYYVVTAVSGPVESANSTQATVTPLRPAPVSWLKLNETSGTSAADATGNNNAGTLVNVPVWIGGKAGNALSLNGTNQYASLPNGVTANLHDFTVATWVYWNGGNNWQRVFDFGRGTSSYMFLSPKNGATGKVRFAITTNGGGGEQKIDGNAALVSGGWHHVAVTLSGSTGTLYIDGQQVGQNTAMTIRPSDLGATTQNWIGRSQYSDPYLNGRVDDFRLYAGALSATEIAALAAPIQTTGLAATGGSAQIALTWNATTEATSYTVRRALATGGAYTMVASGLIGTTFTDTGLTGAKTYYYVVTPADAFGDGANSAEASATTSPDAPGNVTVTAGNGQATLNWSASTGATGYSVLRATSPNGTYTMVASGLTGTSYTDTGLDNGTTYYYAVIATNASGSSANSTQVNALTAPASPTGLAATADNAQVSLLWNSTTGAATYNVLRSTMSGSGYASVASGVTGTSYTDTGLTNGTAYYYVVTATNTGGTSANSSEANATPVALPSPWSTSDVGSTGAIGSASRSPSGVFTITGAGADIWGSSDAFRYVYQTATGDCDITARVVSVQNTHNSAKSGVMIRESLNANSRHAETNLTPAIGLEFLRRTSTGGSTSYSTPVSGVSAPYWVRLVRSGNTFTSYRSSDGVNWTSVGSVTITMSSNVYIGLLVCSHVNGTLCTSTIDSVTANP
jgi:fibronectin type 3 domain-containing protein